MAPLWLILIIKYSPYGERIKIVYAYQVTMDDIIEQGGLIYTVSSLPTYIKVFFFTLPEGNINIKLL